MVGDLVGWQVEEGATGSSGEGRWCGVERSGVRRRVRWERGKRECQCKSKCNEMRKYFEISEEEPPQANISTEKTT